MWKSKHKIINIKTTPPCAQEQFCVKKLVYLKNRLLEICVLQF